MASLRNNDNTWTDHLASKSCEIINKGLKELYNDININTIHSAPRDVNYPHGGPDNILVAIDMPMVSPSCMAPDYSEAQCDYAVAVKVVKHRRIDYDHDADHNAEFLVYSAIGWIKTKELRDLVKTSAMIPRVFINIGTRDPATWRDTAHLTFEAYLTGPELTLHLMKKQDY
jgi:hypothetical protein